MIREAVEAVRNVGQRARNFDGGNIRVRRRLGFIVGSLVISLAAASAPEQVKSQQVDPKLTDLPYRTDSKYERGIMLSTDNACTKLPVIGVGEGPVISISKGNRVWSSAHFTGEVSDREKRTFAYGMTINSTEDSGNILQRQVTITIDPRSHDTPRFLRLETQIGSQIDSQITKLEYCDNTLVNDETRSVR